MTNTSSTYLSLALGGILAVVISWWIYNIQKKTSTKQDETLKRLRELEESHDEVLKSIRDFEQHQEKLLSKILRLEKRIDAIIEANNPDE